MSSDPPAAAADSIEVTTSAEDVATVRGRGELDPRQLATALTTMSGVSTVVVLDLLGVTYFSMEAAEVLLAFTLRAKARGRRLLMQPSAVVARKLTLLGLDGHFPDAEPPHAQ